jgi:hypothetical protein
MRHLIWIVPAIALFLAWWNRPRYESEPQPPEGYDWDWEAA